MSNFNDGIRTLSNDEIAAVAGGSPVSTCSPREASLLAMLQIMGCRPCSPVAANLSCLVKETLCSIRYVNVA
jgi:hypothetical protein